MKMVVFIVFNKKLFLNLTIVFAIMFSLMALPSSANMPLKAPEDTKTLDELLSYMSSHPMFQNIDGITEIMQANKPLLRKLKPGYVDSGMTMNFNVEVFGDVKNEGTYIYQYKKYQKIAVPITILNMSDQLQKIDPRNFGLVPQNLEKGKEVFAPIISAFSLSDQSHLREAYSIYMNAGEEFNIYVHILVPIEIDETKLNMRLLDGKDHADVNIFK